MNAWFWSWRKNLQQNHLQQCWNQQLQEQKDPLATTYKPVKTFNQGKSGASVELVENRQTSEKAILKVYSTYGVREKREIVNLCALKGLKGFPQLLESGILATTGKPFVIMSLLDGQPLSDLALNLLKPNTVHDILMQILKLLETAKSVLGPNFHHYDLHPDNIFVDVGENVPLLAHRPIVSILDFDLATNTYDTKNLSDSRKVLPERTIHFMSKWLTTKIVREFLKTAGLVTDPDLRNWLAIAETMAAMSRPSFRIPLCLTVQQCLERTQATQQRVIKRQRDDEDEKVLDRDLLHFQQLVRQKTERNIDYDHLKLENTISYTEPQIFTYIYKDQAVLALSGIQQINVVITMRQLMPQIYFEFLPRPVELQILTGLVWSRFIKNPVSKEIEVMNETLAGKKVSMFRPYLSLLVRTVVVQFLDLSTLQIIMNLDPKWTNAALGKLFQYLTPNSSLSNNNTTFTFTMPLKNDAPNPCLIHPSYQICLNELKRIHRTITKYLPPQAQHKMFVSETSAHIKVPLLTMTGT